MSRLDLLREQIEVRLKQLERLLPSTYRLTLIARHVDDPDAHVVVTKDDAKAASEALLYTDQYGLERRGELQVTRSERIVVEGEYLGIVGRAPWGWCYLRDGIAFGYWTERQSAIDHLVDAARKARRP